MKLIYSEKIPDSGKYDFKSSRTVSQRKSHYPMWSFYFNGMKTFCGIRKQTYSLNYEREPSSQIRCEVCEKREKVFGWLYNFSLKINHWRYKLFSVIDDFKYKIGF